MITKINLRLSPAEAADEALIKKSIADSISVKLTAVTGYHLLKKSIDARSKQVYYNLTVEAFVNEPFRSHAPTAFNFADVTHSAKKNHHYRRWSCRYFCCAEMHRSRNQTHHSRKGKRCKKSKKGFGHTQ